jgi:hypothetical protein
VTAVLAPAGGVPLRAANWKSTAVLAPAGVLLRSAYWKSTGKVSELFEVVFSPGTGTIVAVNCWEPLGGIPFSVTVHWVDSPAVVWGTLV